MTEGQENRLNSALAKRAGGFGMKNSEISLVRAFDKGRINEHFARLTSAPFALPAPIAARAPETTTVERVDGLAEKLRGGRGEENDYEARIAALEALVLGLVRTNVPYCSAGVTTTRTILMSP